MPETRLKRARMIASGSAAQCASARKRRFMSNGVRGHGPPWPAGAMSCILVSLSWRGLSARSWATHRAISRSRCHSDSRKPSQLSRQSCLKRCVWRMRLKRVMSSSIATSHATNAWRGRAQLGASPWAYASGFCATVMRPIIRPQIPPPIWRQCFPQIPGRGC